jgi:glutamate racemase
VKIIGVIESTVKATIEVNPHHCLIIATPKTIESHSYEDNIKEYYENITLYSKATPMFVPLIEKNDVSITNYIHEYLGEYKDSIDTIILGCTHYPIIKDKIKDFLGNVNIISSSDGVALDARNYLTSNNMLSNNSSMEIYTTGNVDEFYNSSKEFFNYNDTKVNHLDL